MFPEEQEILYRGKLAAFRLHELQFLLQENAPCTHLLVEIKAVEKVLVSIQMGLVRCNLRSSLSDLQGTLKNHANEHELCKILELFNIVSDL